jgi:hypothetical protein
MTTETMALPLQLCVVQLGDKLGSGAFGQVLVVRQVLNYDAQPSKLDDCL